MAGRHSGEGRTHARLQAGALAQRHLRAAVPAFVAVTAMLLLALLLFVAPAHAQTFPKLTGRVVDDAHLLSEPQKADLGSKLGALEAGSGRQLVVATIPSLEGRTIEDYGYRLGRSWAIGQKGKDDGVILLVAPAEHKVRIETGYGARVFVTDAVSSVIVRDSILPRFKAGDMGGGIVAGADQLIQFMSLPPAEMQKRAAAIGEQEKKRASGQGVSLIPIIFWIIIILFVIMPLVRRASGKRYSRGGLSAPVMLWGPGLGGGSNSGSSWGGDGGGFSGGGGSFGGGGASGGW